MQKLKRVLKFLFKTVCILLVIVVFGFIGLGLERVYHVRTMESRHQPIGRQVQLKMAYLGFRYVNDLEENDSTDSELNKFKNLFEIKKLLLEPENIDWYNATKEKYKKLREKSKYLYLNPDINLWRKLYRTTGEFDGDNEIAFILCDPEGIYKGKFSMIRFSGGLSSINTVPLNWLEPNAEAQKEWEAYERSLSEAGAK